MALILYISPDRQLRLREEAGPETRYQQGSMPAIAASLERQRFIGPGESSLAIKPML